MCNQIMIVYQTSSPLVDCPTQLTLIFMILHLYLSVFHDKYQSYKYEKHSREICYKNPHQVMHESYHICVTISYLC